MVERLRSVSESAAFQHTITGFILLAGVLVGLETYPSIVARWGAPLHLLNQLVLAVFVAEILVKMGAEGSRPLRYFRDPWNVFDFAIVVVCFLPVDAQGVAVLRLARLLRVLKLVRALPKLQVLVSALLKSIPSMGYVSLLLFLLFYLYAVAGTMFFGGNDPIHFGNLQLSMLSLFRAVTLEDWTDLMYIQMYGCSGYGYGGLESLCTASAAQPALGVSYFVSFILVGTMVVLNLFVGVIMGGMDEAQREQAEAERLASLGHTPTLADEIHELSVQLEALNAQLHRVKDLARTPAPASRLAEGPQRAAG